MKKTLLIGSTLLLVASAAMGQTPDGPPPPYDLTSDGLVVWPGHRFQTMAIYDLRAAIPVPE